MKDSNWCVCNENSASQCTYRGKKEGKLACSNTGSTMPRTVNQLTIFTSSKTSTEWVPPSTLFIRMIAQFLALHIFFSFTSPDLFRTASIQYQDAVACTNFVKSLQPNGFASEPHYAASNASPAFQTS